MLILRGNTNDIQRQLTAQEFFYDILWITRIGIIIGHDKHLVPDHFAFSVSQFTRQFADQIIQFVYDVQEQTVSHCNTAQLS